MTVSLVEIYVDGEWVEFPDGLKRAAPGDVFRLRDRDEGMVLPMGLLICGEVGKTSANGCPYIVAIDQGRLMIDAEGDICGGVNVDCHETIESALQQASEIRCSLI